MLAKLIVWAATRDLAIARMQRALDELVLVGVATNQGFHARLMADAAYRCGDVDIQFLDRRTDLLGVPADDALEVDVAIAAAIAEDAQRGARRAPPGVTAASGQAPSAWAELARREAVQ